MTVKTDSQHSALATLVFMSAIFILGMCSLASIYGDYREHVGARRTWNEGFETAASIYGGVIKGEKP